MPKYSLFNFVALIAILVFSLLIISENREPSGQFSVPQPQINIPAIGANEKLYIYGAGKVAKLDSVGITYIHNDYLGSANLETDANRNIASTNTYYPFGAELTTTGNEKYTFTGKEVDETQLQYFGARYYNQDTGRFTQIDPIGPGYAYANNNPLRFVDPDGREEKKKTGGGKDVGDILSKIKERENINVLFLSNLYENSRDLRTVLYLPIINNPISGFIPFGSKVFEGFELSQADTLVNKKTSSPEEFYQAFDADTTTTFDLMVITMHGKEDKFVFDGGLTSFLKSDNSITKDDFVENFDGSSIKFREGAACLIISCSFLPGPLWPPGERFAKVIADEFDVPVISSTTTVFIASFPGIFKANVGNYKVVYPSEKAEKVAKK